MKPRRSYARSVLVLLGLSWTVSVQAEVPNALEPEYAEAILAYNARNFSRAIEILNELQKKAPRITEFLELKAIAYKANQQTLEAGEVYRQLVQLKTDAGSPKKEVAPYAFELGVIRFNEKKYQQAEQYLNYAIRSEFNVDVAELYLGLISVQTTQWDRAEIHFQRVADGRIDDIKPAAHFYLGQVYFQKQISANGFGELISAKRLAQRVLKNPSASSDSRAMAEQIIQGVDTALKPFDKGQRFANFSFILGYDSNVLLVPNESDARATTSPEATLKTTLSAAMGYATSPLNAYQLVPSLRFNANKNFNSDTRSGEFSETGASLYITRDALSPRAYGLRLDTSVIFQNEYDATADSSKYRLYNTALTLAPYLKNDLSRKWVLNSELGLRLVSFNGDKDVPETFRRNGPVISVRSGLQSKTARKYLNPGFAAKIEYAGTTGTEFRSLAFGAGATNTHQFRKVQFTQAIDVTRTLYMDSADNRADTLFTVLLSAYRKIGPRWAVLGSMDYTRNASSSAASYSYNRTTVVSGVSYSF